MQRIMNVGWVLSLLLLAGCGGSSAPKGAPVTVTGKISVSGAPLTGHHIILSTTSEDMPKDFRNYTAELGSDGTFTIEKVYPFTYDINFAPVTSVDPMNAETASANPNAESPISAYLIGVKSPLSQEISESKKTIELDITPLQAEIQ